MYFVVSGTVRFEYCDGEDRPLPLGSRIISKNQIFGHDALTVGGSVRCRAVSEEKTVCLAIRPHSLASILHQNLASEEAFGMSQSIKNMMVFREDIPAAAVVGAEATMAFAHGCLGCLSAAQQEGLFNQMLHELIYEGEDLFQVWAWGLGLRA